MSSSTSSSAAIAAAAFGLTFVVAVPLLQTDRVGRKVLSAERLRAKRRREQKYRLERAMMQKSVELRARLQGKSAFSFDPKEDRAFTDLLTKDEEYDALAAEILDGGTESPSIVAIEIDPDDERARREWYLYLAFPPGPDGKKWRRVQAPLFPLCERLAKAFEEKLTSTALCFVADASSGLGSEAIGRAAAGCGVGAALVEEPAWMTSFASLAASGAVAKSKTDRALFALCRMEAWRVRGDVGKCRTVVFTLPGQGCASVLMPKLHRCFPHERHVFAYDSCAETVARGLSLRAAEGRKRKADSKAGVWPSVKQVSSMPRSVTASVPVSPLRSLRKIEDVLVKLPSEGAGIAESWLSAVDALIKLKADEANTGYIPFVCRVGFLLGRTGNIGDTADDVSDLALTNVLQYVTGSRSRPLGEGVLEAARDALREAKVGDLDGRTGTAKEILPHAEFKAIEELAFLHKLVLIQDKTLPDTVQPAKEWSLKAARKLTACACCAPGEGEDDEDEENTAVAAETGGEGRGAANGGAGKFDMSVPGAFATGLRQRPNAPVASNGPSKRSSYVDGKTTFAFDPTKFS